MTTNKLETPDTVNPVRPPNSPVKLPPNVTIMMKIIAAIIVPSAPASAAFHIPPNIPLWAINPTINPTINNPANSYWEKNILTVIASIKPINTAPHFAIQSPLQIANELTCLFIRIIYFF